MFVMTRRAWMTVPAAIWVAARQMEGAPLTQGERDRAMSHLHATRKQFLDLLAGVNEAQWRWKPAPERWSLEEVAEHIALSEETLYQAVQQALAKPAAAVDGAEQRKKDALIVASVPNRERRVQAPEMLRPRKTFPTKAATIEAFKKARDRNIAFVRETQASLREHLADHPALGPLDAYQWLVFISAHCERHIAQMREVTETAGYPKG